MLEGNNFEQYIRNSVNNNINEILDNLGDTKGFKIKELNKNPKTFKIKYKGNIIFIELNSTNLLTPIKNINIGFAFNSNDNNGVTNVKLLNNVTPLEILKYTFSCIKKIILEYKPESISFNGEENKIKLYLSLLKKYGLTDYKKDSLFGYIIYIPDEFYQNNINEVLDNLDSDNIGNKFINDPNMQRPHINYITLKYKNNDIKIWYNYNPETNALYFDFTINGWIIARSLNDDVTPLEMLKIVFTNIKKLLDEYRPNKFSFTASDKKLKLYSSMLKKFGLTDIKINSDGAYEVIIPEGFYQNNINEVLDNLDKIDDNEITKINSINSIVDDKTFSYNYKGNSIDIRLEYYFYNKKLLIKFSINGSLIKFQEFNNNVKANEILLFVFSNIKKKILEYKPKIIGFSASNDKKARIYIYLLNKFGLNDIIKKNENGYDVTIPDNFYQNNVNEVFDNLDSGIELSNPIINDFNNDTTSYKNFKYNHKDNLIEIIVTHYNNLKRIGIDFKINGRSSKFDELKNDVTPIEILYHIFSIIKKIILTYKAKYLSIKATEKKINLYVKLLNKFGLNDYNIIDNRSVLVTIPDSFYQNNISENKNYFKGLSKSTTNKKRVQMKRQADMDDSDPSAYKPMAGDSKGKKLLKTSKHTIKYHKQFDEDCECLNESLSDKIKTALKKKSEKSGIPLGILSSVMRRGMAAWKSGHRPGASQEQWAYARVNSFITKGSGTWGGADKDLAKKVKKKKKKVNEVLDNLDKNSKPQKINNDVFNFSENPNINDVNKTYNYNYKGNIIDIQIIYFSDTRTISIGFKINNSYIKLQDLKNNVTTNEILNYIFSNIKKLFLTYKPKYLKYAGVPKKIMLYKIMLNKFGIKDIENTGVDQNGEIQCEVTIPDEFYNK